MNLNFMYAHCCGSVRSFQVAHLTLSHHRFAIGAGHNGLAADAHSYRTRGRWGSLPDRRKPEFDMDGRAGKSRPRLTEFARPLISTLPEQRRRETDAGVRVLRSRQTEGGRVIEMRSGLFRRASLVLFAPIQHFVRAVPLRVPEAHQPGVRLETRLGAHWDATRRSESSRWCRHHQLLTLGAPMSGNDQ